MPSHMRPTNWVTRGNENPYIDNHIRLHAGPKDPPSSRGAKETHPSRGSTGSLSGSDTIRPTFNNTDIVPNLVIIICTIRQVWGFIKKYIGVVRYGIPYRNPCPDSQTKNFGNPNFNTDPKPNFRESRNSFGISGQIGNPEMILGFWAFGLNYYVFGLKLNLLTLLGCNLLRNPLQYVPIMLQLQDCQSGFKCRCYNCKTLSI
ncbi:hypothetical protein DVH24_019312 [Malus domestica]|uniref:Uncharacterized protein n=1 Tax=Malus domestica TaxID=3750 RepID=A0A498I2M4_MALDO|nr:hypothetical protein DVH24_019312 [Malus domestica]